MHINSSTPHHPDINDDWKDDTSINGPAEDGPYDEYLRKPIWWYHTDHLGSSTYLTDNFGRPSHYYETLPFGEMMVEHNQSKYYKSPYPTSNIGKYDNKWKFNGKELDDATGMYYYGARYYDPRISIFVSVDPLAEKTMTPYQYVTNNPIMFTDPTGMAQEGGGPVPWWKKTLVKGAFMHPLPRLFIENYSSGNGKHIMLNELGMKQVEAMPVSINRGNSGAGEAAKIRTKEMNNFNKSLSKIKPGEGKYVELSVLNKAQNQGTLGSFTVYFQGVLTKDKDGKNWSFKGQMSFYDFWNFDSKPENARTSGSHQATQDGAEWLKGGKGFEIFSHPVDVEQTSRDKYIDWWDNKEVKEIRTVPNQFKNTIESIKKIFTD